MIIFNYRFNKANVFKNLKLRIIINISFKIIKFKISTYYFNKYINKYSKNGLIEIKYIFTFNKISKIRLKYKIYFLNNIKKITISLT